MGNNCILSKKTRFLSWQRINVTNHHIICLFLDELIFFWFLAKKGYTPHGPNIGINFSWNIQVLDVVIIPRPFRILEDRFKKHEFSCCHPENTGSKYQVVNLFPSPQFRRMFFLHLLGIVGMRSISCQPSCPPGLVPAWRLAWGTQWIVGQLRPRRWPLRPRLLQPSTGLGPECRGRHLCLPPHYQGYFSSMVTNKIFYFSLLFHEWQYPI